MILKTNHFDPVKYLENEEDIVYFLEAAAQEAEEANDCLLYTSPSPRD